MKSLDEIEENYKESFDNLIENYKEKLKNSKYREKARKSFKKEFEKILKKYQKESYKYMRNNKEKLLDFSKSKKDSKIEKDLGVYHAYNFDFRQSFSENLKMKWEKFVFYYRRFINNLRYHFVPSSIKLFFFRIGLFLSSLFFDIKVFTRFLFYRIIYFFKRDYYASRDYCKSIIEFFKRRNKKTSVVTKENVEGKDVSGK